MRSVPNLGEGGMGVVFRAHDVKLKRDVAIKVLPEQFSRDPDRVTRFQREAEALASLNHPNIAAIHEINRADDAQFLVLELVEGETLAARIARAPVPIEETIDIAKQICLGLEAAHEKGVIHRDLKPANIQITPDGRVKLLDFGLARIFETEAADSLLSNSPTMMSLSVAGILMGTAAYMSPEQAKGGPVDQRTDIWAFGCVLHEMLTGRRLFQGETVSETIASVLRDELRRDNLPEGTPRRIVLLLEKCLRKSRNRRLQHIGDARIELEDALNENEDPTPLVPPASRATDRSRTVLVSIAAILFFASTAYLSFVHFRETPPKVIPTRFTIPAPEKTTISNVMVTMSPDGSAVAFVGIGDQRELWVRRMGELESHALSGTVGASFPFWSSDSRSIGFFADGKLKRIDLAGGPPQTVTDALVGNGAWNNEGVIVFTKDGAIYRTTANGATPVQVTSLDPSAAETGHFHPRFLPDGDHFLFTVETQTRERDALYVGSLKSPLKKLLLNTTFSADYSAAGFLFFVRGISLLAQPFNAVRLELRGEPFIVHEGININESNHGAAFSVSHDGSIIYRTGGVVRSGIASFDREGKSLGIVAPPNLYQQLNLSNDEKRIVSQMDDANNSNIDAWVFDLDRGTRTRITQDPTQDFDPVRAADDQFIYFQSRRSGKNSAIYRKRSDGTGTEELIMSAEQSNVNVRIDDVSRDGRYLLYHVGPSLFYLPLIGERKPQAYFKSTSGNLDSAPFSYDSRFVAYNSNESGRPEVYVLTFPDASSRSPISTDGGAQPRWRKDGKELFYLSTDGKLMSVMLTPGAKLQASIPKALFQTRTLTQSDSLDQYTVSADGRRFLLIAFQNSQQPDFITVIANWAASLK